MPEDSLLSTIASVAVGLAGFSGIVLAVGRQGAALSDTERYRFAVLLWNALGATFLAIAPMILHALGSSGSSLWRISSGAMAVSVTTLLTVWVARSVGQMRVAPHIFNMKIFGTLLGMHATNVGLQTLAAAGIVDGPGVYAAGLLVLLAHATNQFIRMLFVPLHGAGSPQQEASEV